MTVKKFTLAFSVVLMFLGSPLLSFSQGGKYDALLGTWDVETEGGQYTFIFSFKMVEGELVGMFSGQAGETKMENLSFEKNELKFTVNIDGGGQQMTIDFSATVSGDSLEGMLALEFGDANIKGKKRK